MVLLLERKNSWLMVFLRSSALVLCFQFVHHLSQQVSLNSSARGFHLWHFDSKSEEFLDKVSVMNRSLLVHCQKRFPVSQTNSMYQVAGFGRGSTWIEDLERLQADCEREIIFHSANRFYILEFCRIVHEVYFFLQLLYL